jgi:ABC-type cobalamin/Fe3+-siderophores transport system ATPase subunit
MSLVTPRELRYGRGHGRPTEGYARQARARRFAILEEAATYAKEALQKHVDQMRNLAGDVSHADQRKAAAWLFEIAHGKAVTRNVEEDSGGNVQRTLIVRWMPPDPADRSNVILEEPD